MPTKIKRNEISTIKVIFFNDYGEDLNLEIEHELMGDGDLSEISINCAKTNIQVPANDIKTLNCSLKSQTVGEFNLTISSGDNDKNINDGETRTFFIDYEGHIESHFETFYFDLDDSEMTFNFELEFPSDAIKGSEKVLLSGTDELITASYKDQVKSILNSKELKYNFEYMKECCQQRVAYYYPRLFFLDYLNKTNKIKEGSDYYTRAIESVNFNTHLLCKSPIYQGAYVYFNDGK